MAVFIGKYSTRRHERTNLRFHRISSLIDSYIRRAGLHARTNRVVPFPFPPVKVQRDGRFVTELLLLPFHVLRGQPEFFLHGEGGETSKRGFFLSIKRMEVDPERHRATRRNEDSKIRLEQILLDVSLHRSNFNNATRDNEQRYTLISSVQLNRHSKI